MNDTKTLIKSRDGVFGVEEETLSDGSRVYNVLIFNSLAEVEFRDFSPMNHNEAHEKFDRLRKLFAGEA